MNNCFSIFRSFWKFNFIVVFVIAVLFVSINYRCYAGVKDTIPEECFSTDTSVLSAKLESIRKTVFVHPNQVLECINIIEKNTDDKRIIALCNHYKGFVYLNKSNSEKAIVYSQKALDLFTELKDEYYINIENLNIGVAYLNMSYYTVSNEYLYTALQYFDRINNTLLKGRVYLNLTYSFSDLKNTKKAKEYAFLAEKFIKEAKDTFGFPIAYNNLADIYVQEKNYEMAARYYRRSIQYSEKVQIARTLAYAQYGIGQLFFNANELDSARYYFEKVLNNNGTDDFIKIVSLRNYAELFSKENKNAKSIELLNNAIILGKKTKIKTQLADCYHVMARIYYNQNDYKKAYMYRDSSAVLRDSVFEDNKIKHAAEFEVIYQNEKKQKQIEDLSFENEIQKIEYQKSRNFVIGLTIFLVLLIVSTLFIFRFYRLKTKHENAELEQRLLRSQMNPHFIFNAISSIQNYIIKNKAQEAGLYLANFAKLMRHILVNSREEFISLEDEIETLENYLMLQQLRFDNKFEYKISIADDIDEEEFAVPPMLLQPFVENSIKHGISQKEGKNCMILINFSVINNKLVLEVEDNGIGRSEAGKFKKPGHKSLATEITDNRLKLLGKVFRKKVQIDIVDLIDADNNPKGTKVNIKLPIKTL